ncbi:uncharacterized protein AFUA_7G06210 [Aspergillus fumigatus Af293]|uniref:Uncharacterized protein n=2 Tax=Aspergillus fumigatus TaxID=746128 RepID=Q4WGU0_ASPFU|nr:hypothetical protein AFUA_7G06210 [Aspergillus fumigatus Af293]EAL86851.1 hypothetical protein AFUA_7G06210 [Aspergillus fumigatus Af293]EDP48461.1 hypothetical protein AFUB_091780 [Aspergillus fumigatus A1163]
MHPVLPSSTQGFCSAGLSCIIAQTLPINRVHACIPRPHTQICFPVQSATSCLMMDLSGQVHIHIKPSLHCRLHTDKICTLFWFPKYWTPTPESKYFRTVFSLLQLSCLPSSISGSIALALQACGFVFSGNGLLRLLTAEVEDDDCLLIEKVLAEDGNVDDPVYVTSGVKPGTVATYVATPDMVSRPVCFLQSLPTQPNPHTKAAEKKERMILLLSVKDNDLLNCHRFQPHSEEERWIEHPLDTTEPIILHKQSKMTSVSLVSGAHVFFQVPSGALVDLQYQHDTNRWTAQIMRTQVTVQPGSPLCAIQGPSSVSLFFVGDNNCIYYVTRSTVQDASEWEVLPGARFEQVPDGLLVVPDEGEPGAFISYVLLGSQLCKVDTTGEKPVGTIGEDGTFYPIDSQESAIIINIYCPTLFINGGLFGGGGAGGYGGGGGGGGWSMRGGRWF